MAQIVALAVRSGRILWVDPHDGSTRTLTDRAGPSPDGILVEGGTVYWTTMGRPVAADRSADSAYSARDGGLHAIGLDGHGRRDLLAPGSVTTGKQLASDGAGILYWSDREGCRVSRARVDGTGLADLVVATECDGAETTMCECVGVAVDPQGWLYWSQKGPAKSGRGRIFRTALELPGGLPATARGDVELLWSGLPEPIDLHLADGWMYWTDRGAGPRGNTLNRARVPRPGERGDPPQVLAAGFAEAIGLAVDEDDDVVLVSDLGGTIRRVPIPEGRSAGEGERTIASLGEPITGVAVVRFP